MDIQNYGILFLNFKTHNIKVLSKLFWKTLYIVYFKLQLTNYITSHISKTHIKKHLPKSPSVTFRTKFDHAKTLARPIKISPINVSVSFVFHCLKHCHYTAPLKHGLVNLVSASQWHFQTLPQPNKSLNEGCY